MLHTALRAENRTDEPSLCDTSSNAARVQFCDDTLTQLIPPGEPSRDACSACCCLAVATCTVKLAGNAEVGPQSGFKSHNRQILGRRQGHVGPPGGSSSERLSGSGKTASQVDADSAMQASSGAGAGAGAGNHMYHDQENAGAAGKPDTLALDAMRDASLALQAAVDAMPPAALEDVDSLVEMLKLSVANRIMSGAGPSGADTGSDSDGDSDSDSIAGVSSGTVPASAVGERPRKSTSPSRTLNMLRTWLRAQVPPEAVLDSEKLVFSQTGEFKEYTASNSLSVDGFLYTDNDVDDLADAGVLPRNYCKSCGSRDVQPLNFMSHSLSIRELAFLFKSVLPSVLRPKQLQDSLLVDVGSRLGAVLYGAHLLGGVRRCVGVEINAELCALQQRAVAEFGLGSDGGDGISVVCADIATQRELLADARVVVLHNAFQFFSSPERGAELWRFMQSALATGTFIVSSPSLPEQLACCAGASVPDLSEWVRELPIDYPQAADSQDEYADDDGALFTDLKLYTVVCRDEMHTTQAAPAPTTVAADWNR